MKGGAVGRKAKSDHRGEYAAPSPRPVPRPQPNLRLPAALGALCLLTLLAFANSFRSGFILDNKGLLLDPRIREATPENITLILRHTYWWPTGESGLYRPFTTLTYLFDCAVLGDGDRPGGYHWTNLILHLGNVLLAFAIARRLIRRFWQSFFMAAVWAVHPALTESVTNIVGRADLLAGMGVLAGFLMYLKSAENAAWLAGLAVVTTLGVFSKESAVAIFPVILLYELVWRKGRQRRRIFALGIAATLAPIIAMLFVRSFVLASSPPAEFPFTDNPIVGSDWWTGRLTAISVAVRYLWLTIWPAKLSCDYSYRQIPLAHGSPAVWLAVATVLTAAASTALLLRWNRTCFFFAGFAFLNFLPASNLLFAIGTLMADRLIYLPSLGLAGCVVLAVWRIETIPKLAIVPPLLFSLIAVGFAVRTWIRNRDWQSELAIATADVRVSPNSFKLHRLLAASLFESDPSHSNIDLVITEQEKSIALLASLPNKLSRPEVYRMAGYYYLLKSRQPSAQHNSNLYVKATRYLLRSIAIGEAGQASYQQMDQSGIGHFAAGDPQAYLLLSVAYLESGNADKALSPANQAMALEPVNPQIYRQLSAVFAAQDRRSEAETAAAVEDAITSIDRGNWQDAAELSDQVLHSSGDAYPVTYYLNAMANLKLGNLDAAETSARAAVRLDRDGRNPRVNYILGLILARRRQFRESAELLNAYLDNAPAAPDTETVRHQLHEIDQMVRSRP